jgi:hypothetical protein
VAVGGGGDSAALIVFGLVLPVLGLIAVRPLRRAERQVSVPPEAFAVLRRADALAGLPTTGIEDLAMISEPAQFSDNECIAPDALYVIGSGAVECEADSRRLGVGDSFGDPLRPDPGQFFARGEVRAVVLRRDAFLGAGRPACAPPGEPSLENCQSALSSMRSETPQRADSSRQAVR